MMYTITSDILREKEQDRQREIYMCFYIYTEGGTTDKSSDRERESERERDTEKGLSNTERELRK